MVGRTGLVLAQYLYQVEGMPPNQAVRTVMSTAESKCVVRRVNQEKLETFLAGTMVKEW